MIAYDGSLQAARALAAFQATGLGESGKVHIVSVGADRTRGGSSMPSAPRKFLSHHKIESVPHALSSSAAPAEVILEQVRR